jgi:PAS domain S-box-containing protein
VEQKDGIWIIDSQARTTYANERMAEILGVSPAELIGQDSLMFVFPEDLEAAERLFAAKRDGNVEAFRFRLRRRDGTALPVSVQGTPMYDASGNFNGIVGTFTVVEE